MSHLRTSILLAALVAALAGSAHTTSAEEAANAPAADDAAARKALRESPLTALYRKCYMSAVNLQSVNPAKKGQVGWAAGSIIHESGFILTNSHVIEPNEQTTAILGSGKPFPCRVIARIPEADLGLLKIDSKKSLDAIRLGRSNDVMPAESVLIIGAPNGYPHSVAFGIISAAPPIRTIQMAGGAVIPDALQLDAALNGGNSGGPVINAAGELIGVVMMRTLNTQGINFAIPIDWARKKLAEALGDEKKTGLRVGITVDPLGSPVVAQVAGGSPAEKAGVKPGDVIERVGGLAVTDSLHYFLGLVDRKPGETLALDVKRGGKPLALRIALEGVPVQRAAAPANLVPGIICTAYTGEWTALPDFDQLKPNASTRVDMISHRVWAGGKNHFGLLFEGYVAVPADGLYTFSVLSADGSRLWIGDKLVVDNNGVHPAAEKSGEIRLTAGKHPIRVAYFDGTNAPMLRVFLAGPNLPKQEIVPPMLFSAPK